MKNVILILSLATVLTACGSKSKVDEVAEEVQGADPLTAAVVDIDSFVGVYDLVRMDTEDCAASLQIVKLCGGVQVRNNHAASLSFCNVNKGEVKTGDNRSSKNVTLDGNVLRQVALLFDSRSTPPGKVIESTVDSLILEANGNLKKLSDSQRVSSSCYYQKR